MMSDAGLKAFAGDFYRSPGVEPVLLDCQDRLGLDVLCLLGACWLAQQRRAIDAQGWRAVLASHSTWAGSVIAPVRRARRALKAIDGAQALYEHLKGYELSAEWLALSRLEAELNESAISAAPVDVAQRNLLAYCVATGIHDAEAGRAMARLAHLLERGSRDPKAGPG